MDEHELEDLGMISPLVDIDNYFGVSSKRMLPVILMGVVAFIPCIIYAQFLIQIMSIKVFLILFTIWMTRWSLIIIGEEPKRLAQFKRQIAEVYASAQELMMIKTIHNDGLIEYMNGRVKYLIVVENGSEMDSEVVHSRFYSFIKGLSSSYVPDIYIQNMVGETTLEGRYSKLQFDTSSNASKAYLSIIDFNVELEKNFSLVVRTVFAVKGRRGDFLDMKEKISGELATANVNIFRDLHIAEKDEVGDIIGRDLLMNINFLKLNREKYKTDDYRGCEVIGFDDEALSLLRRGEKTSNGKNKVRGFIKRYE